MKITVIHGDNSSAIFNFLVNTLEEAKKKGVLIEKIYEDSPMGLAEILSGKDLFNQESLYLLEEPEKVTSGELKWISKNAENLQGNLIIYADSKLPLSFLNKLPERSLLKEFKLPKALYVFLESFLPRNSGGCIRLLHELLGSEPPEFVFAVFSRHIRDLYWVSVSPQTLDYPSWRLARLKSQAKAFEAQKLKKAINQLARIDYSAKTGATELAASLDLLIVSLLQ
jgi:DNA polymerase III delta subunit